jgi:glutathione S-transferase
MRGVRAVRQQLCSLLVVLATSGRGCDGLQLQFPKGIWSTLTSMGSSGGGGGGGGGGAGEFSQRGLGWDTLGERLGAVQTQDERERFDLHARGLGKEPLCGATLRLFDSDPGTEPRVNLIRDHAGWCPYCEKVWLVLEEKRVPYSIQHVPMRCYGSNPVGAIPIATIDGVTLRESDDIIALLERTFPDRPLVPDSKSPLAPLVGPLLKLERQIFSCWFRWLTSSSQQPSQQLNFEALMGQVDDALEQGGGPYFLGKDLSIVDLRYAPFLERMAASLPYYKGLLVYGNKRWPALQRWFAAMDSRGTYTRIKGDWYTHVHDLPPQIGGCVPLPQGEKYRREIDGEKWNVPVPPTLEPQAPFTEQEARREAAFSLIRNHQAVVKFSCRGAGLPGMPPVGARLADPRATPNLKFEMPVDLALRQVAHALLDGVEDMAKEGDLSAGMPKEQVRLSLEYLQQRVGVPRDMSFAAAHQLRCYLGWYMKTQLAA